MRKQAGEMRGSVTLTITGHCLQDGLRNTDSTMSLLTILNYKQANPPSPQDPSFHSFCFLNSKCAGGYVNLQMQKGSGCHPDPRLQSPWQHDACTLGYAGQSLVMVRRHWHLRAYACVCMWVHVCVCVGRVRKGSLRKLH